MKHFKIKSPTNGGRYSVLDGLAKFTGRRNYDLIVDLSRVRLVEAYQWGKFDGDFVLPFEAHTFESQWCDSANFSFRGMLDLHSSGAGKWSFGHCSEADPNNAAEVAICRRPNDDNYEMGCFLKKEEDAIRFKFTDLSKHAQKLLRKLLEEFPMQILGHFLQWERENQERIIEEKEERK